MNRRGFLSQLGLAIVGVALAPAINLLQEENTIVCNQGILWHAQNSGEFVTYNSNFTMADFHELVAMLEKHEPDLGVWFDGGLMSQLKN